MGASDTENDKGANPLGPGPTRGPTYVDADPRPIGIPNVWIWIFKGPRGPDNRPVDFFSDQSEPSRWTPIHCTP